MTALKPKQLNTLQAQWYTYTYTVLDGASSTTLPAGFLSNSVTKVSGGNPTTPTRGIVTNAPYNIVKLRKASDALTLDNSGAQIFGRLTYSSPNYIITYYKISSGTEVATTVPVSGLGSYSVEMTYPEVMKFEEIPASSSLIYGINSALVTTGSSISGDLVVNGNTTLGDSSSDTFTINSRLVSNIIPSTDDVLSLGSYNLKFSDVNSSKFTSRGDATDTIKTIYNYNKLSFYNTPFSVDGSNVLNLGTTSATQVNLGKSGSDFIVNSSSTTINSTSTTISGNLIVLGSISYVDLTISGNTTLGDSSSDLIYLTGSINSNVIPYINNYFAIGNNSYKFADGYFTNIHVTDGYLENLHLTGSTLQFNADTYLFNGYSDSTLGVTISAGSSYTQIYTANISSINYSQAQDATAAGGDWSIVSQGGATGFANGKLRLKNPSTNTVLGGGVIVDVGASVSNVSDPFAIESNGSRLVGIAKSSVNTTTITGALSYLALTAGTQVRLVSPNTFNSIEIGDAGISLTHTYGYVDISGGGSPGVTLNTADTNVAISSLNSALLRRSVTGRVYEREFVITITTTDATPSDVTYTTTSGTIYGVELLVTASNDTDNEGGVFAPRVDAYQNIAGTLSRIGIGVTIEGADRLSSSLSTASATITSSGTSIIARVTGIAGKTINWNVILRLRERVQA